MVKVLAQEMKTVGVKNFTVHTCTSVRGRSQYFFATHSVIVTLGGGGGGSPAVTLFYRKMRPCSLP